MEGQVSGGGRRHASSAAVQRGRRRSAGSGHPSAPGAARRARDGGRAPCGSPGDGRAAPSPAGARASRCASRASSWTRGALRWTTTTGRGATRGCGAGRTTTGAARLAPTPAGGVAARAAGAAERRRAARVALSFFTGALLVAGALGCTADETHSHAGYSCARRRGPRACCDGRGVRARFTLRRARDHHLRALLEERGCREQQHGGDDQPRAQELRGPGSRCAGEEVQPVAGEHARR